MKCTESQKHISMMLDGELDEGSRENLLGHVATCRACAEVLERMTSVNHVVKSLQPPAPSPLLEARVREAVSERYMRRSGLPVLTMWGRASLVAAMIVLAVGLGNFAGRSLVDVLSPHGPDTVEELLVQGGNGDTFGELLLELIPNERQR